MGKHCSAQPAGLAGGCADHLAEKDGVPTNLSHMFLCAVLQMADQAVQRAGQRIIMAKQLSPDIPQIDLAIVRSMQSGIYLSLLSGAVSQCASCASSEPLSEPVPRALHDLLLNVFGHCCCYHSVTQDQRVRSSPHVHA